MNQRNNWNNNIIKQKSKNININIEAFDGIRKSNSRIIFGFLLGIIIIDFIYECLD